MAFHLKMSDLEKARQVAERAVKHVAGLALKSRLTRFVIFLHLSCEKVERKQTFEVGFSDSKERFNVWVAYMNLECTYGTEKTADAIFSRASSHNDAKQVRRLGDRVTLICEFRHFQSLLRDAKRC